MARRKPWIHGLLLFAFLVTIASPLAADQTAPPPLSLDQAAAQMAGAISHSKAHSVVVEDLSSAYREPPFLGAELADDFSAALAKAAHGFRVADRPREPATPVASPDASDRAVTPPHNQKSLAIVSGQFWVEGDQLRITLDAFPSENRPRILSVSYTLPAPKELLAHLNDPFVPTANDRPRAGVKGYSLPLCQFCPQPQYTREGADDKIEGNVEMVVIIDATGHVKDVRVLKGLPGGLTEQAIESVQTWRLVPANGPDGKPAAVAINIQVTFKLPH